MPHSAIRDHLKGVDFKKPVEIVDLSKGKKLSQWQIPGSSQGNYYSEVGVKPEKLGINPRAQNRVTKEIFARIPKTYRLKENLSVLKSTANSIKDTWSIKSEPLVVEGGEIQYFTTNKNVFEEL